MFPIPITINIYKKQNLIFYNCKFSYEVTLKNTLSYN